MTLEEAIQKFENGEEVETIEMGGICESYEMGIQRLAFFLAKGKEICKPTYHIKIPDELKEFGYSGAQVAAARWLAEQFIETDYEGLFQRAIRMGHADRIIRIRKKSLSECSEELRGGEI